jgi:hypothetical protein
VLASIDDGGVGLTIARTRDPVNRIVAKIGAMITGEAAAVLSE